MGLRQMLFSYTDMSTIIKYIMNIKLNAKNNQNLQYKENTKKTKEEVEKPKNYAFDNLRHGSLKNMKENALPERIEESWRPRAPSPLRKVTERMLRRREPPRKRIEPTNKQKLAIRRSISII